MEDSSSDQSEVMDSGMDVEDSYSETPGGTNDKAMPDDPTDGTCQQSASSSSSLPIGSAVMLAGLKKEDFNYHVGRVVTAPTQQGRIGVELHGIVWSSPAQGRRRNRAVYDPVSLKPENLRSISLKTPKEISVLGSIPQWAILRLLGDSGRGLPLNVVESIAECLLIHRLEKGDISVAGCSTTRGDYELDAVLDGRDDTWWISGAGSCQQGIGCEYLEFSFGDAPRRVSFFGMMIPALPQGPLSVRDFHLLALRADAVPRGTDQGNEFGDDAWIPASHKSLHTLDRGTMQEYALWPPVDTRRIRLVCSKNAAADSRLSMGIMADCIGLFQVSFA